MRHGVNVFGSIASIFAMILAILTFKNQYPDQWQEIIDMTLHGAKIAGILIAGIAAIAGVVIFFVNNHKAFYFVLQWLAAIALTAASVGTVRWFALHHRHNSDTLVIGSSLAGVLIGWSLWFLAMRLFRRPAMQR